MGKLKFDYIDTDIMVSKLIEANITIEEFLILSLIQRDDKIGMRTLQQYLDIREPLKKEFFIKLSEKSLIKEFDGTPTVKNIIITEKFKTIFINNVKDEDFKLFVDSYMELWPRGVRTMGHLVKADKNECAKKLRKFFIENTGITRDQVLQATKNYINRFEKKAWEGISTSNYFINKEQRGSLLLTECEQIDSNEENQEFIFTKDV